MGAEEQVRLRAHGLPDRPAEGDGEVDIGHRRHVPAAHRVGPGGVELHRSIAAPHEIERRLGGHLRAGPELRHPVMRQRIEIGIGADPFVHHPAQKRPDRTVAGFAEDIPAGDFKPRKGAHDGEVGPLGEARGIGAAEHAFDVLGRLSLHVAFEDVFDHRAHGFRADRGGVAFAPAGDAGIGGELHQNPVAPAPARCGWSGDDDVEVPEFHRGVSFPGIGSPLAIRPAGGAAPRTPRSFPAR